MTIYILNLFFIPFYALLLSFSSLGVRRRNIILCWLVGLQLIFISVFRGETVGADLLGYLEAFKWTDYAKWKELGSLGEYSGWIKMEYGYLVFNKLLSCISDNERLIIWGTSIFIIGGFSVFIYRNSKIPWLSFFLLVGMGFYFQSLNVLRQYMALVIVLNCLVYVQHRCFWKFLLWVVLAALFHKTALFVLLLYPLAKFEINRKFLGILIGIGVALWFLWGYVVAKVAEIGGFASYIIHNEEGGGVTMFVFLLLIVSGGFLVQKKKQRKEEKMDLFYHIMLIALTLQVIGMQFSMFGRLLLYYSVCMIIFIPNVLYSVESKNLKILGIGCVCILSFLFMMIQLLGADSSSVMPYRFMWE